MAKKKSNKPTHKILSPEQYIKTKARLLPIYKCYKGTIPGDNRQMSIFVLRRHPQGSITYAGFMLDRWCLGVKDTLWDFNVEESVFEELLSYMSDSHQVDEIDYVEAHNWVYGALAWAEDVDIKPHKDFAIVQYLLEPDDDNTELIDYDFGRNGEYCLMTTTNLEASKYIPLLRKNLGEGNFTVVIDNDDDYDDYDDDLFGGFKMVPSMEYTYKGKKYPTTAKLNHQEVKAIVETPLENISDEQMVHMLSLPRDSVREDLHALIMQQIGLQWGKSDDELYEGDFNWETVGNSLMFLTKVGTKEYTTPVVLEILRQSYDFWEFNFGDIANILLYPVLYVFYKDNPSALMPFLLEQGPDHRAKICVLELLEYMALGHPELKEEFSMMARTLLEAYKEDLPERTICDGTIVAFAIGIPMALQDTELLPIVEDLYASGMVDEHVNGNIEEVREYFHSGIYPHSLPPTDPYGIRAEYMDFYTCQKSH